MVNKELKSHWNNVYSNNEVEDLGWYENKSEPSLSLVKKYLTMKQAHIVDIGSGATTLIENLLESGYQNLTTLDLSKVALQKGQASLGPERAALVNWVEDDITILKNADQIKPADLWHDRAVLHFLTSEKDQQAYFKNLRSVLKPDGIVLISAFGIGGAQKCSGLDVVNYDAQMLADRLGNEFKLLEEFEHIYTMPSGADRKYIYTVFKRG
jgi:SAM-dependent methyltransferase